jgi:hypothetical protein
MATDAEIYFHALKRIALYRDPEWLRKNGEREYGISGQEAIEMAYENVLCEARDAIRGKRKPKSTMPRGSEVDANGPGTEYRVRPERL